jgi:hypothetical protein
MPTPPLDPVVAAEAAALVARHGSVAQASRVTGIPAGTLQHRLETARRRGLAPDRDAAPTDREVHPKVAKDLKRVRSIRAAVPKAKAAPAGRVAVTDEAERAHPSMTPGEKWRIAETMTRGAVAKTRLAGHFSADLAARSDPIALVFASDQHISINGRTDLERLRIDAEALAEWDDCAVIMGGDGVDNHIKHRAALVNRRSSPTEEYELYDYYLGLVAHRVMVMISGNHDDWTTDAAGVDVVHALARSHRFCSAPDRAVVKVAVGKAKYVVSVRHQFRFSSSLNQTHSIKQMWAHDHADFDIGVVCHHHEAAMEPFRRHGEWRWGLRPGSYQVESTYSRRFGFCQSAPSCPTVVCYPDTKRMVGFLDYREAQVYLRGVLGR